LAVACDLKKENIDKARKNYPRISYLTDVEEVFADASVELVLIATPTSSHFDLATRALKAGKHVFVEKPMTSTLEQARELNALATSVGKTVFVDHTFVFAPAVRRMVELARDGSLGDLMYFDSSRMNLGLIQKDTNVLYDLAIHDLSIADAVMGLQNIEQVTALGSKHYGEQEEHVHLHIECASGVHAHVQVSWLSPVKVRQTIVAGRKGMIVYDDTQPSEKIRVYDRGVDHDTTKPDPFFPKYRSGDILIPALPNIEPLAAEAAHVLLCIRGIERPLVSGKDAERILKILAAANESLKTRLPVSL
jgi:predicted dehydrogenase